MNTEIWNLHRDLQNVNSDHLIARSSVDDERNRQRSLDVFADEIKFVDEGLALYVRAIQGAFREIDRWSDNVGLRSSISMLIHALNSLMAWKHLLTTGYLSEGRLLARSIHEALCQAIVFRDEETLAQNFYEGHQFRPKTIRQYLSKVLVDNSPDQRGVFKQFTSRYIRLSKRAHPTLESFTLRTIGETLGKAVPADVLVGGILSDDLGRQVWLALARDVADSLATVGFVLQDAKGNWERRYEKYRAAVRVRIDEEESEEA